MAHINFFGIDNFRVFKELNQFEFRPITILVGTNSSGKSSLSKGMLCLKSSFEKIEYKSGKESKEGEINMYETETLYFKPYLNLGNFETCINKDSNHSTISFELPMRFPLIEDSFSIKFTYEKEDSLLKRGIQNTVSIRHMNTGKIVFDHDNISGKTKIDFFFLKSKLDEAVLKIISIEQINNEIIKKIEPFQNKIEKIANEIPKNLPNNLIVEIKKLLNKKKEIFPYYNYYNSIESNFDLIDEDSFSNEFIYSSNINKILEKYNLDRTLFNYTVIFDDNFLKSEQKNKLDINESMLTGIVSIDELFSEELSENNNLRSKRDILKKTKSLRVKFLKKIGNKNLSEYLRKVELETLQNMTFEKSYKNSDEETEKWENSFSKFADKFSYLNFDNNLADKLIEKEDLFKDVFEKLLFVELENSIASNFDFLIHGFIFEGIGRSLLTIRNIYETMHYVPSVRAKVDRTFRVGANESYLQEILFSLYKINLTKDSKEFTNKYLSVFNIADTMDLVVSEDSDTTKIYLEKDGIRKELADLGYGVSQILPIILKLAVAISASSPNPLYKYYYSSSIVIIEEPETNLHPALQSKLADMFAECYQKYNIQFIIETHSEYLIRKLQYFTAKKTIKPSDSVIYYFHHPDNVPVGEKQVKKIEILEDGSLSNDFGSGFFDEATNWELELLRLKNLKNRQN